MTSRLPKLSAALVITILVNYLIAWAALIPVSRARMPGVSADAPAGWPAPTPKFWPNPDHVVEKHATGVYLQEWINIDYSRGMDRTESMEYNILVVDSGWPFPCLRRASWHHTHHEIRVSRPKPQITHFPQDLPKASWWNWGAPMPALLDHVDPGWKRLPIRPIPLPFLANTAFWILILLSPFALAKRVRRHNRKRTNRCIPCGYNRAGLAPEAPCPECGHIATV